MAQQTKTVRDLMNSSENVTVTRGTTNDWVARVEGAARTGGPALDPVQVWADHQAEYTVECVRSAGGQDTYALNRVSA